MILLLQNRWNSNSETKKGKKEANLPLHLCLHSSSGNGSSSGVCCCLLLLLVMVSARCSGGQVWQYMPSLSWSLMKCSKFSASGWFDIVAVVVASCQLTLIMLQLPLLRFNVCIRIEIYWQKMCLVIVLRVFGISLLWAPIKWNQVFPNFMQY